MFSDDHFDVRRLDNRRWVLLKDLRYSGKTQNWMVPRGFITDFASVPQFMMWLIPSTGAWTLAAVLHDWLCTVGIINGYISPRDVDGVFRRVLRELNVPWALRWLMWTGVRWGAMFNARRRPGILRDVPLMLGWSVLALPVVLPAAVAIAFGYVLYSAVEGMASLWPSGTES